MDNTQLAELLMGIAKAQAAIIDAVERAEPGFRNNHAVPMLTTAANVRAAVPRIQDLPARILLRMELEDEGKRPVRRLHHLQCFVISDLSINEVN